MTDYQPTDEQIEALAHRLRFHFEGASAVRAALASDEFRAIIRAAQAEALREVAARRPDPVWHRGMYGAPQDMYSASQIDRWMREATDV